jgi:hypothetical protein
MALKSLTFTPSQTRLIYDMVKDHKHEIDDLLDSMMVDEETTTSDINQVMDYYVTLKMILSQLEKKI